MADTSYPITTIEDSNSSLENLYPPKYVKAPQSSSIWLRSIFSLVIYLLLGFYFFQSIGILLLITIIVLIHELGHFLAMKYFRYNDLGIFFLPLIGAYVSGTKREVSQKESAIILLAGPLPGIIIGSLCFWAYTYFPEWQIANIGLNHIGILFIFLNVLNLLPIYPLDGGQILNRVLFDEAEWPSRIFIFLSIAFMVGLAIYYAYYPLLFFPFYILFRTLKDNKISSLEKRADESGIPLNLSYKELPDSSYWEVRKIVIEEVPQFKQVDPGPPYEFHEKEDKIQEIIEGLLHRHLIYDLSIIGKIIVFVLCFAGIAMPWIMGINVISHFSFK